MRNLTITILFGLYAALLSGCSTAWIISQRTDGGVIGYRASSLASQESITRTVRDKIHCSNFTVVSDDLRSSQYTYNATEAVTSRGTASGYVTSDNGQSGYFNGSTQQTTYVPVSKVATSYWRELTYSCSGASSLSRSPDSIAPSTNCVSQCFELSSKGQLKTGMTESECIKAMCSSSR